VRLARSSTCGLLRSAAAQGDEHRSGRESVIELAVSRKGQSFRADGQPRFGGEPCGLFETLRQTTGTRPHCQFSCLVERASFVNPHSSRSRHVGSARSEATGSDADRLKPSEVPRQTSRSPLRCRGRSPVQVAARTGALQARHEAGDSTCAPFTTTRSTGPRRHVTVCLMRVRLKETRARPVRKWGLVEVPCGWSCIPESRVYRNARRFSLMEASWAAISASAHTTCPFGSVRSRPKFRGHGEFN
jgi:hypothetical protein